MTEGPVLAVFAHPDDAEIAAGATIAKWCAGGRPVHLLVLTNGDRGSNDASIDRTELARTREEETVRAAAVLGIETATVLGVHDGELQNAAEVRGRVVSAIRQLRPTTLVSCDPTAWFLDDRYVNHADHRTAGEIALDAVFPARATPISSRNRWSGVSSPIKSSTSGSPGRANQSSRGRDRAPRDEARRARRARDQVAGDMLGYFEEWIPKEAEEAGSRIGVPYAESFRRLALS